MHVEVDPLILRQAAIEFQVADGLVPTDKLMNIDSWQAFMQMIGSSESLQQEYDMGDLLSYLMKMQGADVAEFQKPKDLMLFQQQLLLATSCCNGDKSRNPFSTPMPQIPQSVIEELQKKQAMDAAKNLLHLARTDCRSSRSSFRTFGKDEWNRNSNSFWTSSSSKSSSSRTKPEFLMPRRNQQALIHIHSVRMN